MEDFPKKLHHKLSKRRVQKTLRHLPGAGNLVDFSSNDYLGLSGSREIFERASEILLENNLVKNGASGSRLLSGNHPLYSELEEKLAEFHRTESALVFNSGYDANVGFFGSVPQRGDLVFYDEHIHASIRDGIKIGNAKSYKFKHNDLEDLKKRCCIAQGKGLAGRSAKARTNDMTDNEAVEGPVPSTSTPLGTGAVEVYVVTESVFSMDGDSPDLKALAEFCQENNYRLVVDEAHALGVFGKNGEGLVQTLGLQDSLFARIVTFGKSMGCHGAAILGSVFLKRYLVNFARSLIFTTGLPPHSVATILASYQNLTKPTTYERDESELPASPPMPKSSTKEESIRTGQDSVSGLTASDKNQFDLSAAPSVAALSEKIEFFKRQLAIAIPNLRTTSNSGKLEANCAPSPSVRRKPFFIPSTSAIHSCIIPGSEKVKAVAQKLKDGGFDVRPILSPTVPQGQERLRICLHAFNTDEEIIELIRLLVIFTR
ncbi:aminotransferase class I/II-fold pyridoxal phosphate-dependent enzyme [Pricia sp. S334]|uniref:Aminotransferase class I/II-fold pyridoxal phosphate-dependent enzyme n=1 Tax=Pricia mediterranea TaxID=3076079 RepID=A0ABU3L7K7_9FLAO|nr:aminotransferase class I/II-fold pyridoxal phosphate-dependent enzyme [Pricia sp. S334]MDT7829164.1 aminotransferase class I/II-fold pyridoxal phosphate-dependent enzyme [Pricia sp. S334]